MPSFTDTSDQEWSIRVTNGRLKSISSDLGIDLLPSKTSGEVLMSLAYDIPNLVNVLFLLCEDQCKERGVTDEQFGELFDGESFDRATEAFIEAYVSFCPSLIRQGLLKTMKAQKLGEEVMLSRLEKELSPDRVTQMVDQQMDQALKSAEVSLGGTSSD